VSEGLTWNHFSLPGDFAWRGDLSSVLSNYEQLPEVANHTIFAASLVAWLKDRKVPFLVLLDTCYDGKPDAFYWKRVIPLDDKTDCSSDISGVCAALGRQLGPVRKLDDQATEMAKSFNEMANDFRGANRFESAYPVLFSAKPGSVVPTVAHPFDPDPKGTPVAPLARRAMLIIEPVLKRGQSLSFGGFIQQMESPTLDSGTSPAVSSSAMPKEASLLLVSAGSRRGRSESRVGTAVAPAICCSNPKDPTPPISPTPQ